MGSRVPSPFSFEDVNKRDILFILGVLSVVFQLALSK